MQGVYAISPDSIFFEAEIFSFGNSSCSTRVVRTLSVSLALGAHVTKGLVSEGWVRKQEGIG